jgi:hypothetical protein
MNARFDAPAHTSSLAMRACLAKLRRSRMPALLSYHRLTQAFPRLTLACALPLALAACGESGMQGMHSPGAQRRLWPMPR